MVENNQIDLCPRPIINIKGKESAETDEVNQLMFNNFWYKKQLFTWKEKNIASSIRNEKNIQ